MTLNNKRTIIAVLSGVFLISLIFVQWMEVSRRAAEAGGAHEVAIPASSAQCVDCHGESTPGIIDHWKDSTHALKGVGCVECHEAKDGEPDAFKHYGVTIATIVTPRDCAKCHALEAEEFQQSHHAKGGNILASLDNFLAETVEGSRVPFNPHGTPIATPAGPMDMVNGLSSAFSGCQQCHGSKVALLATDGGGITVDDLKPGPDGLPTDPAVLQRIQRDENGRPKFHAGTWPNTGIGRLNLDGSRGSCSACHSRHDFSPRRARRPENCGKCHLGPDHPQKEIFEESKHGAAYRDLKEKMNLDSKTWVLGKDYSQAPTCATCHMSGHSRNGGKITHDPGERISWTNRPPISVVRDTDEHHKIVTATDPAERQKKIKDTAAAKRARMKDVCMHCHTPDYVNNFYTQYDGLVTLYNEKFARPGKEIVTAMLENGLRTKTPFDDEIEWTWFYLWHHEGRRARHGASMMAPDYTHWHGMFEVAERFYMELIPQALEVVEHAKHDPKLKKGAENVEKVIQGILARPEHAWFTKGAGEDAEAIRKAMEAKYGAGASGKK